MRAFCKMYAHFAYLKNTSNQSKFHKLQRLFYLFDLIVLMLYSLLALFFSFALCVPPILIGDGTPFRAKFPFEWENYNQHPILFSCVYILQCVFAFSILLTIVLIDNIGCQIFTGITLNLKLFCIRIRELGSLHNENRLEELHQVIQFHQYIIKYVMRSNIQMNAGSRKIFKFIFLV